MPVIDNRPCVSTSLGSWSVPSSRADKETARYGAPSNWRAVDHPITVWVIEDGDDFRETVVSLVDSHAGMWCPMSFGNAEDALAELNRSIAPDVLLVDIGLPGMDGVACVERLRRVAPNANIVMLTIHEDSDTIFRASSINFKLCFPRALSANAAYKS